MSHKLLPWVSWAEWEHVRRCLLDGGIEAGGSRSVLAAGVARVAAWRARGRVPLAADITASLVEAQLQDLQLLEQQHSLGHPASAVSEHALRLMHALPIIRLVNGIADSQQRGRVAASVAVLSNIAGLPPLLVDIRHDATHGELPSLAILRRGCKLAMEWLKANYWDAQAWQLDTSRNQITQVLAALLASCTVAAVKGAALGPNSTDAACTGSESGGNEEDGQQGGDRLPWLPGLDQLLPGAAHAAQGTPDVGLEQPASPTAPMPPSILLYQASSYSAAEGRKQRKELLSQLRSLVPTAWVHALVEPLLDSAALHPPIATYTTACKGQHSGVLQDDVWAVLEGRAPPPQPPHQQPQQGISGRSSAPVLATVAVAHKAWVTCLSLVLKTYPALRGVLLQGCVHRLCHAASLPTSPHSSQQHVRTGLPQQACCSASNSTRGSADSTLPPWCTSSSHFSQQHELPATALALYSWSVQLLGSTPPLPLQGGGAGGKAGRQGEASTGGKQQRAEPPVLCLPAVQSSPLSAWQLVQVLTCLLHEGRSDGLSKSSTSSLAAGCVHRLTAWLVHELQRHVSLAEAEVVSLKQRLQSSDSDEKGSDAGGEGREESAAAHMCGLPQWVPSAKELIRLSLRDLGPRAAHPQSQPLKPVQMHLPQRPQTSGVSPQEGASLPALDVAVLDAVQAQQVLLVRRATEARRRRHQKHTSEPVAAGSAASQACEAGWGHSQPAVCAQGELPLAESCHPMSEGVEDRAPEDRKRRQQHTVQHAGPWVGGEQGQDEMSHDSGPGRKRWRMAQQWEPCVIGCLPDAMQVGGQVPTLKLPSMQHSPFHFPAAAALLHCNGEGQPNADADADAVFDTRLPVVAPETHVTELQQGGQERGWRSGDVFEDEGGREEEGVQMLAGQLTWEKTNLLQAQLNLTYL